MERGGGVHTVPVPNSKRWCNKHDGRVISRHNSKEVAVGVGRVAARRLRVEHTIHLEDGTIGEKNSYGNDPCPPRDGE